MNKLASLAWMVLTIIMTTGAACAQNVFVVGDASLVQSDYASHRLAATLDAQGYSVVNSPRDYDYLISIAVNDYKLAPEAYAIKPEGRHISVYGGDARGMVYGALALVEDLQRGVRLDQIQARTETPRLPFRAIKHNFPWDSYRSSWALDQHLATTRDPAYWEAFLDMMAENRFNSLTLWNLHPWTYMIRSRNFPEASPFNDEEMEEWKHLHREIFRMAKARGIDTYLVPWNIYVSKEFAQAHDVGHENFYPYYNSKGDTSELIKRYVRESVAQVLEEYPDLTGIGLSRSEAMGGMTAQQRDDWLAETYHQAIRSAQRPVKIIELVPPSSGLTMDGSTSVETERLTRKGIEAIDFADGPIWLAPKFNWSHGHSTPTLVRVHGGKFGDTYYDPAPDNYKITWIMRNEDFFALRWGEPSFVREHIKQNATASYVGGYIIGSDTYIPALDYFTAIKKGVDWRFAFERQWLFYKLWGRLMYNPKTPDAVFVQEFERRHGAGGSNLLRAYELASKTPLRLASLFDSTWDHTLYSEGMMSLAGTAMAYIDVDRLIEQPVLDPAYVSIADYADATMKRHGFGAERITPPILANQLEADCREALRLVESIDTSGSTALMYEVADVKTWAHLGLHLAEKIRGATALQTYRKVGGEDNKTQSIAHLEKALAQWDKVVAITRPIYRDMLLTHMVGSSKSLNPDAPFHWAIIRPQVAADVETARKASIRQGMKRPSAYLRR